MTRLEFCLLTAVLPTVLACLGSVSIGCEGPLPSGGSNAITYFGRVPDSYEVCFHVGDDLVTLTPSVDCDPAGETAYSFNIIVDGGSDQDGDPCNFDFSYTQPIISTENPTTGIRIFQIPIPGTDDDFSVQGGFLGAAADGDAQMELPEGSCEILWAAGTGPICRADEQEICDLLFECCESMLLVPPVFGSCLDVVNECDGVACQNVLAGYTQCVQPPICPTDEDLDGDCTLLNDCCNAIDLSKDDLVTCLDTAAACDPSDCEALLMEYPSCTQPAASSLPMQ